MRPRSGGVYRWCMMRSANTRDWRHLRWSSWLATCGSMAAVAMVFGEYVGSLVPGGVGREAETASAVIVTFGVLQWRGVRIGDVAQQLTSLLKSIALIGLAVVALVTTIDPVLAAPVTPLPTPTGLAFAGAIVIALQSAIYTNKAGSAQSTLARSCAIRHATSARDDRRRLARARDLLVAQRCVSPRGSDTGDRG